MGLQVHALAEHADASTHAILQQLLDCGANPNITRCSLERDVALHVATFDETVRMLIDEGGGMNLQPGLEFLYLDWNYTWT
jgi:hypothetical protein